MNGLAAVFQEILGWPGLGQVRPGVNVSDRETQWTENYRVPDVAVFLTGGAAENRGDYWYGGPDFVVEIISPGDFSREKLNFYSQLQVREVMFIDRRPWQIELFRLRSTARRKPAAASSFELKQVAGSQPGEETVASAVIPFELRLDPASPRPMLTISHSSRQRTI